MRIVTGDHAIEGEYFTVGVEHDTTDEKQKIKVRISINGKLLSDDECDDPPCYQMGLVIPQGSSGRILDIQAESAGKIISRQIRVSSSDTSTTFVAQA